MEETEINYKFRKTIFVVFCIALVAGLSIFISITKRQNIKLNESSNQEIIVGSEVLGVADKIGPEQIIKNASTEVLAKWDEGIQNTSFVYIESVSDKTRKHRLNGYSLVSKTNSKELKADLTDYLLNIELQPDNSNSSQLSSAYKTSRTICVIEEYESSYDIRLTCGEIK